MYLLSHYRYWKCNEESSTRNYFWQIFLLVIINDVNPNKSLIAQITQHYCNDMMSQNLITWIPSTILMSAESIWDNNICVTTINNNIQQHLISDIPSVTVSHIMKSTYSTGTFICRQLFESACQEDSKTSMPCLIL